MSTMPRAKTSLVFDMGMKSVMLPAGSMPRIGFSGGPCSAEAWALAASGSTRIPSFSGSGMLQFSCGLKGFDLGLVDDEIFVSGFGVLQDDLMVFPIPHRKKPHPVPRLEPGHCSTVFCRLGALSHGDDS